MKHSPSPGLAWLTVTGPIWLPLLVYLIGTAMGANETQTYPQRDRPMQRTITEAEVNRQADEWRQRLKSHFEEVPIIRPVWDPATLSYQLKPTTTWVKRSDV